MSQTNCRNPSRILSGVNKLACLMYQRRLNQEEIPVGIIKDIFQITTPRSTSPQQLTRSRCERLRNFSCLEGRLLSGNQEIASYWPFLSHSGKEMMQRETSMAAYRAPSMAAVRPIEPYRQSSRQRK